MEEHFEEHSSWAAVLIKKSFLSYLHVSKSFGGGTKFLFHLEKWKFWNFFFKIFCNLLYILFCWLFLHFIIIMFIFVPINIKIILLSRYKIISIYWKDEIKCLVKTSMIDSNHLPVRTSLMLRKVRFFWIIFYVLPNFWYIQKP